MLPNQSHAPTTAELVALQSSVDSLGIKLSRTPLVNCDTRNLREAAEEMDWLLDRVMSVSQRLGIEIANRRRASAPTYKVTAVGLMLLDPRPVVSDLDRVKLAEKEAQAEAHTYQFTPGVDVAPLDHPPGCACSVCVNRDLRCLAVTNTSLDGERRCG